MGVLANMPWLDFTLPDGMNTVGAVNVAYLFKPNMTGFYLTFRSFFYHELEVKYGKYMSLYLKNKSRHIREFLDESNKLRDDFLFSMDFSEDTDVQKKHSAGTIIAKFYEKGKIPSDEELIDDLNYFLELYQFVIDNYEDKTDLSVDEWVEVLENEEIIDEKMFSILNIMYNMDDSSATTGQISEKREEIGFDDEKSYNSIIISNSRRIKEFLNKKPIYNDDGTENYWTRFFYGKKVDGAFQFKLQDNLNEAFGRLNRINEIRDKTDSFDVINTNNEEKQESEVENMSEENNFNSFYDYLLKKEYLFDKETIENYLLSLKVKPFAILTGNSGTGKTKLSQLFAQYLNSNIVDYGQKNHDSKKFTASVKVGKSAINRGWAISRHDSIKLIPKMKCEEPFPVLIDGVPAKGKINFNVRFFYQPKEELVNHLNELAEKDPNQRITLELDAPFENSNDDEKYQNSLNKDSNEYISFKTNDSRINNDFFGLSNHFVCRVLGLDKYGEMDFYFDGERSSEIIWARTQARSFDKELINHLKSLDDLSDLEIKINKEDLLNTLFISDSKEETNISFERKIGAHQNWCLPNSSFKNFLHVKARSSWRVIVDGIEAIVDFAVYSVCFSIRDEELRNHLNQKNPNDTIEIKADLSTLDYHGDKSELFKKFSNSVKEDVSINDTNYKIIPVGANWTENRHIVGYYNVITNEYQSTPAYDLIKAANESKEPHFLILDEMNLSHVERYFADFLSAIESGEKIPLYGEEELTLPQNLFIIGTVNVDETTYMFSPKVLDRANVIEFETYSALDYMKNKINLDAPDGDISYLEDPLAGNYIRDYGIDELRNLFDEVIVDGNPFWNILTEEIFSFQEILKESGFDFGFRVINEIVRFMAVAWEYENKPPEFSNWTRYFDACIKQKMLPKLHGSERIIGETLDDLFAKCVGQHLTYETANYPESARKLKEMKKVLRKQRYVSFIN